MWNVKETPWYTCLYMLILMCFYHRGIDSTMCTDEANLDGFTNVLPMCRSGVLIAGRVVIDTYDTGVLDYDSCQCIVRLSGINTGPVNIQTGPYPGTAPTTGCGSVLRFTRYPIHTYTEYECEPIAGDIIQNFVNSERLNITLSKVDNNNQWQSGHCINIRSGIDLVVACYGGPESSSSTTPTTTKTTISTTTTTTIPTTTTTSTTTTTTIPTTTKTTTPISSSIQTVTNGTDSTSGGVNGGDGTVKEDAIGIEVIAGAAGGGAVLIIIIIIVIVVVIKRKKGADVKRTEGNFSVDIQPYAVTTPKFYHNDGVDTLTPNSLYESAGPRDPDTNHTLTPNSLYESAGPQDPDTSHVVTATGDVYAQVQKPNKRGHSQTEHSNNTEHTKASPSGDVYATVNKPKKETNDVKGELQNDDSKRPSRYKNQEGLVYAEVGDTAPRPQSRPPVRPKPSAIADRVIYSEVNTGV